PEEKNHRQPTPCQGARRLLMIAAAASLLLLLAVAADQLLRGPHTNDGAGAWMKAMTLSAPALWTAGSPMRHPETVHPGVDLRHAAGLVTAQ
ncbi:hypothetical protein, partial [Desulfosarcina sp.]|uniref:hypothetical protein n=1 Tax=Desulfosarcina sp. TaxID=2027861 RepID=UPI0035651532